MNEFVRWIHGYESGIGLAR
jgi:hypothetical protein